MHDIFVVSWSGAYGGLAFELHSLAKRIMTLCCSSSGGCERNWSTFSQLSSLQNYAFHM